LTTREGLDSYAEAKDAQIDEETLPFDGQRARETPARRNKPFTDPNIEKAAAESPWHDRCAQDHGGQYSSRLGWQQQLVWDGPQGRKSSLAERSHTSPRRGQQTPPDVLGGA
jgi:hypothetical protein